MNQLVKFIPILKDKIWGGTKLSDILHKERISKNLGESWELSDIDNDTSVVANGNLKGKNLKELIFEFKSDLMGEKIYNHFRDKFPLLIKFIDAKEALSVQLHPGDKLAKERHNSFGKTEMWYIIQADEKANLIVGFNKNVSKKQYLDKLNNKKLISILNFEEVKKGDVYFISPGLVHAIGSGVMLAEIQQTSDITYRIYDWNRPNKDGTYRSLHTKEALDTLNYSSQKPYAVSYNQTLNETSEIVSCPYFTTNIIPLDGKITVNHTKKDSFVIYMCVEGQVEFFYNKDVEMLKMGETILVPACIKKLELVSSEKSKLLEIYIK